jgi:hypothetical protein
MIIVSDIFQTDWKWQGPRQASAAAMSPDQPA